MKKNRFKTIISGMPVALLTVIAIPVTSFAAIVDDLPEYMRSNVYLDVLTLKMWT